MKKVAVFVEGQTELIFAGELIRHIFGHNNVDIEEQEIISHQVQTIRSVDDTSSTAYFFRIYDCHGGGNASTVISDIKEQFSSLIKASFSYIIGIRDVYPATDLVKLRSGLSSGLPPTATPPVEIFLAVREIEAWFLAEENHYSLMDESLTIPLVNEIVKFDITTTSTEKINHPSSILRAIYQSVGKDYRKKKWEVEHTVYALDYENLYLAVRYRNNSLNELLTCLDRLIP
jgi:hypothetical protein